MTNVERIEAEYDQLAYPSYPLPYCQPTRLAAMARLMGLQAPPIAGARVLELGCASGGNLIPLAARHPETRFVGVDLSSRHIELGAQQIRQLQLRNIELRQGDLATEVFEPRAYDFIVCHGVFSWVPEHVQQGIFRILAESLTANGIAAISYNVLPGWHYKRITRDICLHYAGNGGTPDERAARARVGFTQLVEGMPSDSRPIRCSCTTKRSRLPVGRIRTFAESSLPSGTLLIFFANLWRKRMLAGSTI